METKKYALNELCITEEINREMKTFLEMNTTAQHIETDEIQQKSDESEMYRK